MAVSSSSLINTSGISVGTDGKIKVSGLSSGIDTQALIAAQIAAKTVPIDNIKTKISANNTIIQTYKDLKAKVETFQDTLDLLRNNLSFGSANVFRTMTATGSTAAGPLAAPGYTPSDVNSLLTTSFSTRAQAATHTVTIQQLAKAQQISSDFQGSSGDDLSLTGTITLNGENITVAATDSLLDIRDKVNASAANVSATIVSADDTHHYLVLTSRTTGTGSNAITITQTALSDTLGITDGSAAPKTELVEAKDAIIDVDGITNITRSTNTITDVIEGVTLRLTKAEPDTVITLEVQPDLNAIKSTLGDFVTAYNDLRSFIKDQNTASDRNDDGTVDSGEFGALYNKSILRGVADQLSFINATQLSSNTDGYRSLGQIGIVMNTNYELEVDDSVLDTKLLSDVGAVSNLFGFSFTSSDSRVQAISRTSSTAGGTYYLSFNGTDGDGLVTAGRIATVAASGTTSNGSLTFNGNNVVTATDTTAANGLGLAFLDTTPLLGAMPDIELTVSRGIADTFFDYFDGLTATALGTFDQEIANLSDQNARYESQVEVLNIRLDNERDSLTNKSAAMEAALAQLQQLQKQIDSFFSSDSNN